MFRFALNREVWWPIKLPQRGEKGIEWVECKVLFRLIDRDEMKEMDRKAAKGLMQRLNSLKTTPVAKDATADTVATQMEEVIEEQLKSDQELYQRLRDRTRDWKGIAAVDADGKDVEFEFSDDNLKALLADEGIYKAFSDGLMEASRGAKAKN